LVSVSVHPSQHFLLEVNNRLGNLGQVCNLFADTGVGGSSIRLDRVDRAGERPSAVIGIQVIECVGNRVLVDRLADALENWDERLFTAHVHLRDQRRYRLLVVIIALDDRTASGHPRGNRSQNCLRRRAADGGAGQVQRQRQNIRGRIQRLSIGGFAPDELQIADVNQDKTRRDKLVPASFGCQLRILGGRRKKAVQAGRLVIILKQRIEIRILVERGLRGTCITEYRATGRRRHCGGQTQRANNSRESHADLLSG